MLTQRCEYFDGVDDVPIVNLDERVGIEDDGNAIGVDRRKNASLHPNQQSTNATASKTTSIVNANNTIIT